MVILDELAPARPVRGEEIFELVVRMLTRLERKRSSRRTFSRFAARSRTRRK